MGPFGGLALSVKPVEKAVSKAPDLVGNAYLVLLAVQIEGQEFLVASELLQKSKDVVCTSFISEFPESETTFSLQPKEAPIIG